MRLPVSQQQSNIEISCRQFSRRHFVPTEKYVVYMRNMYMILEFIMQTTLYLVLVFYESAAIREDYLSY